MKKEKVLNIKKKTLKGVAIGAICAVIFSFYNCTPNAEDILKKYEKYHEVPQLQNGIGLHLEKDYTDTRYISDFGFSGVHYLNPYDTENYDEVMSNMKDILSSRFIVLDAGNPTRQIDFVGFKFKNSNKNTLSLDFDKKSDFESLPKFIIVGFKGIRKSESVKLGTPALFVLFEIIKKDYDIKVLTPVPLLAENLFPTDYPEAQFVEAKIKKQVVITKTEYSDKINLGGGKTLSVSLILVSKDDEKSIEKCEITHSTQIDNPNGSSRVTNESKYGYEINISSNGNFSEKKSDFIINGTLTKTGIKGTISMKGRNYSYTAKQNNSSY